MEFFQSPDQWKIIFYIAGELVFLVWLHNFQLSSFHPIGGIYLFGCIVYFIWAEGEVQSWAVQEDINAPTELDSKRGTSNPALDIKE